MGSRSAMPSRLTSLRPPFRSSSSAGRCGPRPTAPTASSKSPSTPPGFGCMSNACSRLPPNPSLPLVLSLAPAMLRLSVLLVLLVALAPALTAQPGADSALVVQIYAGLARGDVPAVAAVPEAVTTEDGRVVVVGTARRADPAT